METRNPYETELQRRNRERREAIVAEFKATMAKYPAASRTMVYKKLAHKYTVGVATVVRYVAAAERQERIYGPHGW